MQSDKPTSCSQCARLNVSDELLAKLNIQFAPLAKFNSRTMKYVDNLWHHATLTSEGLSPTNDTRYNDHSYEIKELFHIIKTYGIKPGWYPIFWDHIEEIANNTGIDYIANDEELLRLCVQHS
jgi:hypothetical protein